MAVDALILDADGVLIPPWGIRRYLEREYPSIAAQQAEFFFGVFQECLVGRADLRVVLPPFLETWGWPLSPDDFINRWFEEEKNPDGRVVQVVRAVRASGIPCYLATNQERYRTSYMRHDMGVDDLFDQVFSSADIRFKKPDAPFFEAIANSIGVPAERILFWDDSQGHVDAARACGWQAERYADFGEFVDRLNRVLDVDGLQGFGYRVDRFRLERHGTHPFPSTY